MTSGWPQTVARLPEVDQPSVPLRAKTTPTFLTPPPTDELKSGMVASHFVSETPFIVAGPSFVSFDDDRIAPVDSLTMNAAASRGRTSGTAMEAIPRPRSSAEATRGRGPGSQARRRGA